MQETKNYQLNQWEPTDEVRREDFNNDNAAIDAALKAVADTAGSKASAEELTAVSESVSALSTQVAACGNCVITSGSYTGTGAAKTLTFDFKPLAVFLAAYPQTSGDDIAALIYGSTITYSHTYGTLPNITWSTKKVTFGDGSDYFTKSNAAVKYVAFGQSV